MDPLYSVSFWHFLDWLEVDTFHQMKPFTCKSGRGTLKKSFEYGFLTGTRLMGILRIHLTIYLPECKGCWLGEEKSIILAKNNYNSSFLPKSINWNPRICQWKAEDNMGSSHKIMNHFEWLGFQVAEMYVMKVKSLSDIEVLFPGISFLTSVSKFIQRLLI